MILHDLGMHAAGVERLLGWRSRFGTGRNDTDKQGSTDEMRDYRFHFRSSGILPMIASSSARATW